MKRINFTDTTITQKPYVTINNQNYEVQDGVYTGGTDLNASTFNTMQDNIEEAINALYPVGSIIIRDNNEDMSNFLGFTWQKVFAGKMLIGVDSTDNDFKTIGATGGAKEVTLGIENLPPHSFTFPAGTNATTSADYDRAASAFAGGNPKNLSTNIVGGGQAHNNMPPYVVVAYWKRTA